MANTFNDVENTMLRTWNRCVMAFNLQEDNGEAALVKYINSLDERGKKQVAIMLKAVELRGKEAVRQEVMKGLENGKS